MDFSHVLTAIGDQGSIHTAYSLSTECYNFQLAAIDKAFGKTCLQNSKFQSFQCQTVRGMNNFNNTNTAGHRRLHR